MSLKEIYVYLEDEGVDVWRPVQAESLGNQLYRIVSENTDPEGEKWQFTTGQIVRCRQKEFEGGKIGLAATEQVLAS